MPKDVKLTDEERRILAEIEQCEDDLRTRLPWTELEQREGNRRDFYGWSAIVVGVVVLVAGLVANLGLIPFAGYVMLLVGVTRVSARISWTGVRRRLSNIRRDISPPRSGPDGT